MSWDRSGLPGFAIDIERVLSPFADKLTGISFPGGVVGPFASCRTEGYFFTSNRFAGSLFR